VHHPTVYPVYYNCQHLEAVAQKAVSSERKAFDEVQDVAVKGLE
jgi:hypothetical protein